MKLNRVAMVAVGSIGLAAFAADPKVTPSELDHARLYLQQTQNLVVGATRGLSKAQWNFKPAPDRWSIAEVVEHMVLAQHLILGPLREQLAKAPAPREGDYKHVDEIVINQMPDRTATFQAPDFLQPTGRWMPAESMDRLRKNYAQLTEYVETTPDLRQQAVESPSSESSFQRHLRLNGRISVDSYRGRPILSATQNRYWRSALTPISRRDENSRRPVGWLRASRAAWR